MAEDLVSADFSQLNTDTEPEGVDDALIAGVQLSSLVAIAGVFQFVFYQEVTGFVVGASILFSFTGFWLISSLVGGEVDTTGFTRDVPMFGILPNLMLSALRGEWDPWDTKLLILSCVALLLLWMIGFFDYLFPG